MSWTWGKGSPCMVVRNLTASYANLTGCLLKPLRCLPLQGLHSPDSEKVELGSLGARHFGLRGAHQLSYFFSLRMTPSSCMWASNCPYSSSEPSQMWIYSGWHS